MEDDVEANLNSPHMCYFGRRVRQLIERQLHFLKVHRAQEWLRLQRVLHHLAAERQLIPLDFELLYNFN